MSGDKITIASLNAQGLNGAKKRRDVIDHLRSKNYTIICLVDTHFTKDQERYITSEWGYQAVYNSFNSQSRGVAIFLTNKFEFKIHNTHRDTNGNVLLLDIEIEKHRITLAAIYGPNTDEPTFYEHLQENIIKMGNIHTIITGDFNLLLNPSIDGINYKNVNNPNARQTVLKMMTELNLYDVWRDENNDKKTFTWKRKLSPQTIQMGRLDFFLVSEALTNFTRDEKIIPGYRSDHSAISISLVFNKINKSRTFWKFNSSLLNNVKYINEIKQVITDVKRQYALAPYNLDNIEQIENTMFQTNINPQLFFEMLLLEIRSKTIAFSSAVKKNEINLIAQLESEIAILETLDPVSNFDTIQIKNDTLKTIRETKLQGTLIRSRARWIEKREKPSNYFCNLENRHFVSKRMTSLIKENGEEATDIESINTVVSSFYKHLYSSKEDDIEEVNLNTRLNGDTPKLSDDEANSLEGNIALEEAATVLNSMKNNKSPGSTGFTVEFFKFFWKDLGVFLVKSINYGFQIKELSSTQKEGVITCIPKGNKCKKYIQNWRPISLLNVSYKIASGCIANRIKTILPSIINSDQSGFMSGRFSGDNIRLLYDILNSSLEHKKTGLLLLIDFEKAFDSVAWSFIKKSLVYFNFKNNIIQWVETFYNNIKSTVIVNNSPTPWFPIQRGCRQGDPISPYIFLICGEILANMIRQSEHIKGYSLFEREIKISQYADDTSLFLDGSKDSFEYCIETILEYAKYSGLKMNFDKTKVVWFGCEYPPNTIFMPHLNFEWNPQVFSMLGVDFTIDLKDITDINITKKLTEITHELNQWSKRDLTPFGRITVIKTLIISKIVHFLIALPSPSLKLLNEINKLLYTYLWNGKPDQIKRTSAKQSLSKGGLGMIDLQLFDKALKLTWIKRLFINNTAWKSIIELKYPKIMNIPKFGDEYKDKILNNMENPFWKEVITYYYSFYAKYKFKTKNELEATSFLYNSKVTIGNRVITNRDLVDGGVLYISQLKTDDTFLTLQEFNTRFNVNLNFLQFNSIVNSIKTYLAKHQHLKPSKEVNNQPAFNKIVTTLKGSSPIYREFLETAEKGVTGYKKWSKIMNIEETYWENTFKILKNTTNDTKLHWLQFRIIHSILTTNRSVSKFRQDQNPMCSFCNTHSETIHHLMWNCTHTKTFWNELSNYINRRASHAHNFKFTEKLVLFGKCEIISTDKICDFIILVAKFYIYRCKVQTTNLNLKIFIAELYNRFLVEKRINNDSLIFKCLWAPYKQLFQSLMTT